MASARRGGAFSAFQQFAKKVEVASEAAPPERQAAPAARARPPLRLRDLSLQEVRDLLESLRAAVAAQGFQRALDALRSRELGAFKKRAEVARLLGRAWKTPLKSIGLGINAHSFPLVLAAVRSHGSETGIRTLSEEVERVLRIFPGALFGSKAGQLKGALSQLPNPNERGAFSRLAPSVEHLACTDTVTPQASADLRGRPMTLGEAKDLLKALKGVSSEEDFQHGL